MTWYVDQIAISARRLIYFYVVDEIPEVLYTWSIVCESEEFIDTKSGHIFTFTITSAVCFLNASIQPLVGKAQQIEEQVNAFTEFTLDQLNPFYFEKGTIGVINLLGNFPTNGIEFRWHFDDESLPSTTTDTPQISHVYDKVGTFSFKVVASNPAQRQSVTSTVTVYEPLQGKQLNYICWLIWRKVINESFICYCNAFIHWLDEY